MKMVVVKDYEEMSLKASEIIVELLKEKKNATLGLATGSSPIGIYKNLIKKYKEGEISFKDVTTYNLDEAINISNWDLESLGWVISRLRKAGCKNIKIISYDEGAEYRG